MLLLVKRICQDLKKPITEVLSLPQEELTWWSVFYSIDDNRDAPIVEQITPENVTVEDSIRQLQGVLG